MCSDTLFRNVMNRLRRVASVREKLVAGLLIVLITAVLVEIALRVADRAGLTGIWETRRAALSHSIWIKSLDPDLVYTHRPDYHKNGVRYTERSGILRPDDVMQDAAGAFRIAALGDSVAAAIDLPYEERAFTLLERMLNRQGFQRPVEILNFGVNGYSTLQEAELLAVQVDDFAPDMLVLQYCMNDFYPSPNPYDWFKDHSPVYSLDLVRYLLDRRPGMFSYPPAAYWQDLYREDKAGWHNVETGFSRIAEYAKTRGIQVLLVIFPLFSKEGWEAGEAAAHHARVTKLGEAAGFRVLDLLPVYSSYDIEKVRLSAEDTFHPGPLGQEIAAKALDMWFEAHAGLVQR